MAPITEKKRSRFIVALGLTAWLLGGNISYAWEPTIDPRVGSAQETHTRDLAECRELARDAHGDPATEAFKGVVFGALGGAATGAIIGGVSGNAGKGAGYGAAIGGVGGGLYQGLSTDDHYKHSYIRCLEGRGHRVIN
jgi:outer membrane lipoprotein SlyB